jgi:hypothetical protein
MNRRPASGAFAVHEDTLSGVRSTAPCPADALVNAAVRFTAPKVGKLARGERDRVRTIGHLQ